VTTQCIASAKYEYFLYGTRLTSDSPFRFPGASDSSEPLADVAFVEGTAQAFQRFVDLRTSAERFVCHTMPDGSTYLRWTDMFEFSVAHDGSCVIYRSLDGCDRDVLQNFLFGQALAVALVRQGVEPLHAAVVQIGESAVGFLGDCTFGKSTLIASFMQAGHRILTDDLLVVDSRGGTPTALPGSGRIKLMPDSARAFFADGRGERLNPRTTKQLFSIDSARRQRTGLPLRHLFVLPNPEERNLTTSINLLPIARTSLVCELVKNSFTGEIVDRTRLAGQFAFATQLASDVDGIRLRYPSGLHHLAALRTAIVEHVC